MFSVVLTVVLTVGVALSISFNLFHISQVSPEPSSDESDSDMSESKFLSHSVNDTCVVESLAASAQCPSADEAVEAECSVSQNDAAGNLHFEQLHPWDSEEDFRIPFSFPLPSGLY